MKAYLWLSQHSETDSEANSLCLSYALAVGGFVRVLLAYHEQLEWYGAGLAAAERLPNDAYACQLMLSLGQTYLTMGQHDRAKQFLELGFERAQRTNDPAMEAVALSDLGHLYLHDGQIRMAAELLEASIRSVREARDPAQRKALSHIEVSSLSDLAQLHSRLGKHRKAVGFAKRAQRIGGSGPVAGVLGDIYMHWFTLSDPTPIRLIWQAAVFRLKIGKLYKATGYLEEDLAFARREGNRRSECGCLNSLGVISYLLMHNDKGIQYLENALAVAIEIGSPGAEATCLTQLGVGYNTSGDFRRAVDCHKRSARLAHDAGDRQAEGNALHNLSQALHNLGDDVQAATNAEAALRILEGIQSPVADKTRELIARLQRAHHHRTGAR